MGSFVDTVFAVGMKLIYEPSRNETLRRVVTALSDCSGVAFLPEEPEALDDPEVQDVTLIHPSYTAANGFPNSWISVSVGSYPESRLGAVFVNILLAEVEDQVEAEWSAGELIFRRLVSEMKPLLGFMTVWVVDDDDDDPMFPSEKPLDGSVLPREFTPLTYFSGPDRDESLRRRLEALTVPVSRPLDSGWLVQAVDRPHDQPQAAFLDELRVLTDRPISYRRPGPD